MYKFNNKVIRKIFYFIFYFLFPPFSSVSAVDFEEVNICWVPRN